MSNKTSAMPEYGNHKWALIVIRTSPLQQPLVGSRGRCSMITCRAAMFGHGRTPWALRHAHTVGRPRSPDHKRHLAQSLFGLFARSELAICFSTSSTANYRSNELGSTPLDIGDRIHEPPKLFFSKLRALHAAQPITSATWLKASAWLNACWTLGSKPLPGSTAGSTAGSPRGRRTHDRRQSHPAPVRAERRGLV